MRTSPDSVGGITFAFGYQYQRMAYALALTLKRYGIPLTVVVPDGDTEGPRVYEKLENEVNVVPLKGYFGKFEYEALAYDLSPYEVTLKFDADVIVPSDAYLLELVPLIETFGLVSGAACDLTGTRNTATIYRRIESKFELPTVYSALFGFKKGELAHSFFEKVKWLFATWYSLPKFAQVMPPTTDSLYSIAWKAIAKGNPKEGLPFLHMKPGIAGSHVPYDWVNHVPYVLDDNGGLRVNSHRIRIPFHYFDKAFMSDAVLERLESYVCSS